MKSNNLATDCFANEQFLLNIFGLLTNQNVFYRVYSLSLLILLTIYPFSVIPEILELYHVNFNDFIFSMVFEVGNFTGLLPGLITFWYRFQLKALYEKLYLLDEPSNFTSKEGENVFIRKYKDIIRKQSNIGYSALMFVLISNISIAALLSLNGNKWILPFGCGPANINNNLQVIIQIIIFSILAVILFLVLTIYINTLTLLCGHCKVLQKYIVIIFTDGYNGEILKDCEIKPTENRIIDWESFQVQLRNIVPYHIGIIDVANQLETMYSFIMLIVFGGTSIVMCLIIYHAEKSTEILKTISDISFIITGYFIMIVISSYGEKIATESEQIGNVCYEIDFVDCDVRVQKSLMLIMLRSQRPLTPTIGKIRVVGFQTMLSIFQSIYSYYTILGNVTNK